MKLCLACNQELKGCGCKFMKASDGTKIHKNCEFRYEESLKKSKGLGDTIDKITTITGIKPLIKSLDGKDCGCDKRKDKLNKIFPYK